MKSLPYHYQIKGVRLLHRFLQKGGGALLGDDMGLGKAQPLDAKLLTSDGWMRMGDVIPGDYVIGSNGRPTKVLAVYPQGVKEVFKVTFRDGSSTECCDDHLWTTQHPASKRGGCAPQTNPLKLIRQKLHDKRGNCRHFIPVVKAVGFRETTLPIDPYLLGYILANGNISQDSVNISIPDEETVGRLIPLLPPHLELKHTGEINWRVVDTRNRSGRKFNNSLIRTLVLLGLMGHKAEKKFAPLPYLTSSIAQRTALFQGLMDGDGSVNKKDLHLEYTSSSSRLAKAVQELVRSLGGTAAIYRRDDPKYTYKGEVRTGQTSYRVSIALPEGVRPFQLSRKSKIYRTRIKYQPTRAMVRVEPAGRKPCQCIQVEAPDGLYVTDDYIVTHNTYEVLLYAERHPECLPVLVVCPAHLKWNWHSEVSNHTDWRAEVLGGMTPLRRPPNPPPPVTIINYDVLEPWVKYLQRLRPGLIIFDEGHMLQGRSTLRTRKSRVVARGVPRRVVVTGTPILSSPANLWPLLNIARPDLYPSFTPYGHQFCGARKEMWGWEYKGATNLPTLHRQLRDDMMVRRLKSEVMTELPAKVRAVVPLEMARPAEYRRALKDFFNWLKEREGEVTARRAERAKSLTHVGYLKRLSAELKLPAALNWVRDFLASGEKLLLFGHHKKILNEIHRTFRTVSVLITGDTPEKKREMAWSHFLNHSQCQLLVGNTRAAGTGKSAKGVVYTAFVEFDWVPAVHTQAEERTRGVGRGRKGVSSTSYYLVAKGSVEEHIVKLLQDRQESVGEALDGGRGEDLGVFDLFIKEIQRQLRIK